MPWCIAAVYAEGAWKAFTVESHTESGTCTAPEREKWDGVCTHDCSHASEMHDVRLLREKREFLALDVLAKHPQ